MASLVVETVTSRKQKKQFFHLPWSLYRDDPLWIPPLRTNQKELLGYKKHPFYEENEVQTFLALKDGQPVGRIAAIANYGHNRAHKESRGFFGFFESIDDVEVARGLFDAARAWLAERNLDTIRGPVNPSLNYECGLLVEGFDSSPCFMMTYNPEYYGRLIEACGFEQTQDLLAFHGHVNMLEGLDEKLAFIGAEAKSRFNVKVRPLDPSRFTEDVDAYVDLYNKSMVGTWGFVPLTQGEMKHFATGLKQLLVPEVTCFGEVDGKVIGAAFCLLDYNERIKQIDGKLFPFGFLKLLRNRKGIRNMRAVATNVVPEYQAWGIGLVVMQGLLPRVLEWGIENCEFSWVLESNKLSRGTLEKGGAKRYKTYRLYDFEGR